MYIAKILVYKSYQAKVLTVLKLNSSSVPAAQDEQQVPTESECRPYIEKALKQLGTSDATPGRLTYWFHRNRPRTI